MGATNATLYRGFEITINVGNGGWIIQQPSPDGTKLAFLATVPGPANDPTPAMEWVDRHLQKGTQ